MSGVEILVAVLILVGLVGVVVPVLPGSALVVLGVLVWAIDVGTGRAWVVFAIATGLVVVGEVVKYVVPGRRLQEAGVPRRTLAVGALVGVVGFFVVPVIGLFLGFVLGVYLAELTRLGHELAWPTTKRAVRAVGLSILIELAAALLAAAVWIAGVVAT